MIRQHKLLIDKNCPMCQLYGKGFKKLNMVDSDTICYYQTVDNKIISQIDAERAKSEVALYDGSTNQTIYGVDAFLTIFQQDNRLLKALFSFKPVYWLATKMYRFISFNRHVIAGIPQKPTERDCTPVIHKPYRWTYILLVAVITSFIVGAFSHLLAARIGISMPAYQEWLICFGQIGWQFIAISLIKKEKRLDYLGNMSTVSMIGALLLIPLFMFDWIGPLNALHLMTYFGVVVGYMFLTHLKRAKNLQISWPISISWLSYRIIVLIIIVSLQFI